MGKNREINHETPGLPGGGEGGETNVREAASTANPLMATGETKAVNKGGRPQGARNKRPVKSASRTAPSALPPNSTTATQVTGNIQQAIPLLGSMGKSIAGLRNCGLTEAQILTSVRSFF